MSGNAWGVVPRVDVPPVVSNPVPSPSLPAAPTLPAAPSLPAPPSPPPVPSVPDAPSLPVGGSGSETGAAATPVPNPTPSQAPASPPSAAPVGSSASVQAAAPAPAASGSGSGWSTAGRGSPYAGDRSNRLTARRRRAHERRLRRTVARLAGCLYGVSPFDRRVLVLRAGPGRVRALSRLAVARRLDVKPRRVRRSERRGLRRLRGTSRFLGCGSPRHFSAVRLLTAAPFVAAEAAGLLGPPATQVRDRSRSDAEGRVLGRRAGRGTLPPLAQLDPIAPLEDTESNGPNPMILAALLGATLVLGVLALRYGLREDASARVGGPSPTTGREGESGPSRGDAAGRPAEGDPFDWEPPPPPWSSS